MKKLLIILLTTIYTISALGVTLHFFYCCHKLSNVSISAVEPVDNCKPVSKGCCTNKAVTIKLSKDQVKTTVHQQSIPTYTIVPAIAYQCIITNSLVAQTVQSKHPLVYPPPNQPSRQILYCIFRI